jgi:hypothetical protein
MSNNCLKKWGIHICLTNFCFRNDLTRNVSIYKNEVFMYTCKLCVKVCLNTFMEPLHKFTLFCRLCVGTI